MGTKVLLFAIFRLILVFGWQPDSPIMQLMSHGQSDADKPVSLVLSAKTSSGLHNVTFFSRPILNSSDHKTFFPFSCCLAWPFSALSWPHRCQSLCLCLNPFLSHWASLEGSWDFRVPARNTRLRSQSRSSRRRSAFASGPSTRSQTKRRRSQRTLVIAMGHRSLAMGLHRSQ